ncbi:isocitrate lyase/PEP mutase family protein [Nonomuraea cavernae]|uniref:Carboxyvinyl-carboxyphosphonate phosphorylmutase n=1 Tax=Nonomuraea cavernae TaxID=2045107 RepID=A0A917YTP5_9ACTN|nr:isocitrate lyase/phosphoenolpyruvate mutase family protein [Nonomuraea cavernae]MCA2185314.1 isocitrate lyase/phosphoenolpyruvate mutase family protein [Nonomuraea cavernae]GGO66084.1 carboxyvinyl-carboxyphosphonate phosphorylmutase [Nonomuraea cavernae]
MTTDRAAALRELHVPGRPLILPNVWDAASARAVVEAGFPVVATGSAAVAEVLGYDDGEATPVAEMMAAIARIARAVAAPVTADVERGYRLPPAELAERLIATGAVGCNLEDTDQATGALVDVEEQAAFLAAVRAAAGPGLVINARVDTYLRGERAREVAVARARRYLEAGADCVYPIGLADEKEIERLVTEVGGPVNVLFRPGTPSLARLAELGVARVSFGHGLHAAAHAHARALFQAVAEGRDPYA